MQTLLTIIHIFTSILLILVVLLQSGKGGGMGATFGGASQQIFGGRGAGSFLTKITTGAAIIFFLSSLTLSMIGSRERSVLEKELDAKEKQAQQAELEEQEGTTGQADSETEPSDGMTSTPPEGEDTGMPVEMDAEVETEETPDAKADREKDETE